MNLKPEHVKIPFTHHVTLLLRLKTLKFHFTIPLKKINTLCNGVMSFIYQNNDGVVWE